MALALTKLALKTLTQPMNIKHKTIVKTASLGLSQIKNRFCILAPHVKFLIIYP